MISSLEWKTDAFTKEFKGTDTTAFFASKPKWLLIIQYLVDEEAKNFNRNSLNEKDEIKESADVIFNYIKGMGGAFYKYSVEEEKDVLKGNENVDVTLEEVTDGFDGVIKKLNSGILNLRSKADKEAKAKEEAENRQAEDQNETKWKDYIANHRDIGMFTLFVHHTTVIPSDEPPFALKLSKCFLFFAKFVLLVILFIQLILFVVLVYNSWTCYTTSIGISNDQKLLACAVAIIYLIILPLLGIQKHREITESPLIGNAEGGQLQQTVIVDRFMSFVLEPLLSLINVSFLFIQKETINIIVNAMAFRFIIELKDVVKTLFIKSFPPDIHHYRTLSKNPNWTLFVEGFDHWEGDARKKFILSSFIMNIVLTIFCITAALLCIIFSLIYL